MKSHIALIAFLLVLLHSVKMQSQGTLTANAGGSSYTCPNVPDTIGGSPTASGGKAPYTYSWSPSGGLSSTTIANPLATISVATNYTVVVTDSTGTKATASVYVDFRPIAYAHAGKSQSFCLGGSATIGTGNPASGAVTYTWSPAAGLDNASAPSPLASPTITTTYVVTMNESPCATMTDSVTVLVHQPPPVHAGPWVVIQLGQKTTLQGSGATVYLWTPSNTITRNGTANPDAEPTQTTLYTVSAHDQYGCINTDTVTVFVDRDSSLVIYNTFSPNGDGVNDLWYIGNIIQYPNSKLDIYNRYGKLVFTKIGYYNEWDGKNFGDELPEGTYYYMIDLKNGTKVYRGSVTIIR
jgi:gliding motility-associated-like protein